MLRPLSALVLLAACSEYEIAPHDYADEFVQVNVEVLTDVLFVVDDSASMREEQARLRANFGAFLDVIAESEADFHVGVTTTDTESESAGLLHGGLHDRTTSALERRLGASLQVGTHGSRDERGLEAALLALDGRNAGFPRDGAMLSVIVVSDEDDESPGSVEGYVEAFVERAGEAEHGFHGIVGDLPEGCATGTSAAAAGPRYLDAIAATGGRRASICADDYSVLLEQVGLDVAGLPDTFELSQVPNLDTLEVFVDEVRIPQRDIDGWTYDPGPNAIVFHGRAIPRAGMVIGVQYGAMVPE